MAPIFLENNKLDIHWLKNARNQQYEVLASNVKCSIAHYTRCFFILSKFNSLLRYRYYTFTTLFSCTTELNTELYKIILYKFGQKC